MTNYVSCSSCGSAIITEKYEKRFGQCRTCYERKNIPLPIRLKNALGR